MNILEIISFFSPEKGGSVNVVYNLTKHLLLLNHTVTIFTSQEVNNEYYNEIEKCGGNVISLKHINVCNYYISFTYLFWLIKNIKHYDLIHLHNCRSFQNDITFVISRLYKKPYIIQPHGSSQNAIYKGKIKKIYDFFIGKSILKNASTIIAVSQIEKEILKAYNNVVVIPNGIDIKDKKNICEIKRIEEKKILLYVGRIHPIKGLEFLIDSFKELCNYTNEYMLYIVGPYSKYQNKLKNKISSLKLDGIRIINDPNNIGYYYYIADILLYLPKYEIFGIVPFEALLFDNAIIVTSGNGCSQLIEQANCGLLVEYRSTNDVVKAIKYYENHNDNRRIMINNGITFINKCLKWEVITKEVVKIYENNFELYNSNL